VHSPVCSSAVRPERYVTHLVVVVIYKAVVVFCVRIQPEALGDWSWKVAGLLRERKRMTASTL
jgi:hypothetical protein